MKSVLVTLANDAYAAHAKQLFYSAQVRGRWGYDLCLLTDGLSPENRSWFARRGIHIHEAQPVGQLEGSRWPAVLLLKFELFSTYFHTWDTVVFLDSDIIVVGPIGALAHKTGMRAVTDCQPQLKWQLTVDGAVHEFLKSIGISPAASVFNAGVLVFEPRRIPPDRYGLIVEYFRQLKGSLVYPEQAVLNIAFHNEWKKLASCYNVYVPLVRYLPTWMRSYRGPILHFNYSPKPWSRTSAFHENWSENMRHSASVRSGAGGNSGLANCRETVYSIIPNIARRVYAMRLFWREQGRRGQ